MISNLPITDAHIHVDPYNGEGPVLTARKFYNSGGRVMIIPNKPAWITNEPYNFKKNMDNTVKYAKEINQETDVRAYVFLGVHPAEYSNLIRRGETYHIAYLKVMQSIDYAVKLAETEDTVIGIGEIGRPHYPVEDMELEYHNMILKYCLEKGKDYNLPVMLHTEDLKSDDFKSISDYCKSIHLKPKNVIKHHCSDEVLESENHGLSVSLTSNKKNIISALEKDKNAGFLMETDFFDDNSKPGVVLGPKTVAKRTRQLLETEEMSMKQAENIHIKNVEKVFKIDQS